MAENICQLLFLQFNHYLVNLQQCLLSVFIIGNTHYTEISGLVQMQDPPTFISWKQFSALIVITSQIQVGQQGRDLEIDDKL